MISIVPHILAATFTAMSSLRHQFLAVSRLTIEAVGTAVTLILVLLGVAALAVVAAVARGLAEAARGLAEALGVLARIGAMLMSALLLMALFGVVVLRLLLHH